MSFPPSFFIPLVFVTLSRMLAAKTDLLMKDDSRDSSAMRYSKDRAFLRSLTLSLPPPPPSMPRHWLCRPEVGTHGSSSKLLGAGRPYRGRIIPFETLFQPPPPSEISHWKSCPVARPHVFIREIISFNFSCSSFDSFDLLDEQEDF